MIRDTRPEFRVQYKDSGGTWFNLSGPYSEYSDALEKLISEATADPEYDYRIVRNDVLGFITGGGNINE